VFIVLSPALAVAFIAVQLGPRPVRGLVPDESPLGVEVDLARIEVASLMGDADTAFSIGAALVNQPGDPALQARTHAQLA
jgi:hypothetical protein